MKLALSIILCFIAMPILAEETADIRAVESCSSQHSNFVKIEKCLPEEHVGVVMLDAAVSEQALGTKAKSIVNKCLELNDGKYVGAWSCLSNAMTAAARLASKIPEGAEISDPNFAILNQPTALPYLEQIEATAKALFPEKSFWGGNMYQSLK